MSQKKRPAMAPPPAAEPPCSASVRGTPSKPFIFDGTMMMMFFRAVFLGCVALQAHGFAISSSKSSGKKLLTNDRSTGGGGFGAKNEVPVALHTPDLSPTIQTLVKFLNSQGSKGLNDGIEVGLDKDTGIRGIYATRQFKKGQILLKIPSDCALALSDPQLGGSDVPTIAHSGRNLILMYMEDDQAKVVWKPYLDTLPTLDSQFAPTPDCFLSAEIEELEFPRAVQMALQRKQEVMDLAAAEGMSVEELQFATWLVSSRSFRLEISAGEQVQMPDGVSAPSKAISVLLPYLDLLNHSSNAPNAELHLIDPEKDEAWFAIRATRNIPEGKEVTITYGNGVNSSVEILGSYGFVPTENKSDALMLKKGGEGCIEKPEDWSSTLAEDLAAYETAEGNRRTILALRIKLKKAYADIISD